MDGTITTPATSPAPIPAEASLPTTGVLRRVLSHPGLVCGLVLWQPKATVLIPSLVIVGCGAATIL